MVKPRRLQLALSLLLPIHALVLGAGFFSPYDPDVQNRALPFAPPMRPHWVDAHGKFHFRPFVYPHVAVPGRFAVYEPDVRRAIPIRFFLSGPKRNSAGGLHSPRHLLGTEAGAPIFLLGTDEYGRDQLSRLLHAGQVSLLAGLAGTAVSVGLGLLLGSLAGFYGGLLDGAIMWLTELFLALPWLYLLFALRAFLPLHTPPRESLLLLIMVVGVIGWARPARLIRGAVLSAKERNYVLAARGFGASDAYVLRRHVLPQSFGIVVTQAGLLIPHYILAEVALSYLGLGIGEPTPSLGNMLAEIQVQSVSSSYWWMLLPGVALIPLLAGYYSLTDALHERAGLIQV
jgi:peptide/nickel transport system permease protein